MKESLCPPNTSSCPQSPGDPIKIWQGPSGQRLGGESGWGLGSPSTHHAATAGRAREVATAPCSSGSCTCSRLLGQTSCLTQQPGPQGPPIPAGCSASPLRAKHSLPKGGDGSVFAQHSCTPHARAGPGPSAGGWAWHMCGTESCAAVSLEPDPLLEIGFSHFNLLCGLRLAGMRESAEDIRFCMAREASTGPESGSG